MYEHSCIESSRWPLKAVGKDGYGCDRGLTNRRQANMACSGAVEVRPFQAKKKPYAASEAEGLSGEAVKGNPGDDGNPQSR